MAKLKDGTRIYGNANIDSTLTTLDLVVTGNMTIQGTTTTVDSTITTIEDPVITLGTNGTADGLDRGLILQYNDGAAKTGFLGWDQSLGEFALASTTTWDSANNAVTIGTYGNIHGLHFIGQGDTLANIAGANVTGTVPNANNSAFAGNVTGNAQANITSVGTLTGLTVGNATANTTFGNGTITAGGVVAITDTTNSTSNTSGALTVAGGAGVGGNLYVGGSIYGNFAGNIAAKGANTQVQFNDDGVQNATSGLTFTKTDNALTATGTITGGNLSTGGTANVTGTANVGNLVTIGYANIDKDLLIGKAGGGANSANANITGTLTVGDLATVNTLRTVGAANIEGTLTVVGGANTALTGNLSVTGDTTSTSGNIGLTNGSITVGGGANVTGTANVGNLTTGGDITGTGLSSTANVQYLTVRSTANITGTANVGNLVTPGTASIDKDLLVGTVGNVANANITGSLKVGSILGDLIPTTNYGGNLGNSTNAWKDLWLSGSTINLGTQTITSNVDGVAVTNNLTVATLSVTGNANVGNLNSVGTIVGANVTANNLSDTQVVYANASKVLTSNTAFTFAESTGTLSATLFTGTITTNAQPNITSVGTLTDLTVTNVATANINGYAAAVSGNAQANITSVGTLTSVTVSGNATVQGNLVTDNIRANSTNITITAGAGNSNITLAPTGDGTVDVSSKRITGLATPTQATDAATKGYVDAAAQGLDIKNSVRVTTSSDIDLTTGGLLTIDSVTTVAGDRVLVKGQTNKSQNGIYIVAAGAWARSGDAYETGQLTPGSFTFVEEGTNYRDSGWVISTNGVITLGTSIIEWTQFSGSGSYSASNGVQLIGSNFSANVDDSTIAVVSGALKVKDGLTLVTPNIGVATGTSLNLGSGAIDSGNITVAANADITLSGADSQITGANLVSATYITGTLTTEAQPNITSVGTLTDANISGTLNVGGNAFIANANGIYTDGYYYADGTEIDFQTAAGNATELQFKATGSNDLASSPNLTFSGTALTVTGTANVSGQVIAGNIKTDSLTTGRVTLQGAGNVLADSANLTFSSDTLVVTGTANVSGTVNAGNITSSGLTSTHVVFADTGGRLTSDADLTFDGTELKANAANVVNAFTAANITDRALTSGRVTFAGAGGLLGDSDNFKFDTSTNVMTVTGNIQLNGTAGEGSLNGNGSISMTGNITGARLEATGGGLILTTGNANVGNLNATYIAGTLTTAAQPNITSVGNLTALTVTGLTTLDTLANVKISGGANGQIISTDGAGNLSFISNDSGKIVNGSSNVSIPTLDGNIIMVSGGTTVLTVTGVGANITGTLDVTGNISGNHISAANTITASANTDSTSSITGTIKVTGGMAATGNIYTGKAVGFANNNGGTASKAYIQFNDIANSLDFIFN